MILRIIAGLGVLLVFLAGLSILLWQSGYERALRDQQQKECVSLGYEWTNTNGCFIPIQLPTE